MAEEDQLQTTNVNATETKRPEKKGTSSDLDRNTGINISFVKNFIMNFNYYTFVKCFFQGERKGQRQRARKG